MIVILKHQAKQEQIDKWKVFLTNLGLRIDESKGDHSTILGLVGDTTRVDADLIASLDAVEAVADGLRVFLADDALFAEHARMRFRTGDVLGVELLVDGQRCAEALRELADVFREST